MLLGRHNECEALDQLLQRIRTGQSSVLVLRGEAGIGKTSLLEYVAERASGCRIARAAGIQSEMELAFAGLHHLCAPMLDGLDGLPQPQQDALRTAFGLQEGGPPERFLVALAALSLLAETAETLPLVCIVDDAQWLDHASAQVIAFVARRLLAERIAVVCAVREPTDADAFTDLPELRVAGLADAEARSLLASSVPGRLDERVRERIVAETRGNPLALVELTRGLTPAELAGGFGLPDARPLTGRIEQRYLQRIELLPRDSRRFLLAAAAEPVGDVDLLRRAAERLGIAGGAAGPAEAAELIALGSSVRFKHPLVRSAVYRGATAPDRRAVHQAFAEVTDPDADPDRRAWHRASATATPDEDVAAEMVRSADRAQARGGMAAAAAFLERATELTPDPALRVERALTAAQAKLDVADPAAASELLTAAQLGPLDPLQHARLERLGAQIAFARRRGNDAPPLLLEAAGRLEALDAAEARETYLEAIAAAMFAGRLGTGPGVVDVARAARSAPPAREAGRAADLLLDGLATRFADGYAAAVSPLSHALRAFGEQDDDSRWLWLACRLAQDLWDDELWHELATRGVSVARDTGALSLLPIAATYRAALHVHAGEFSAASALIDETDAITQATGIAPLKYAALMLVAWRGDDARARALIDPARTEATARGEGMGLGVIEWATALLHNGNVRYDDALAAAQRATDHDDVGIFAWAVVELIEAAVRGGRPELAAAMLEPLSERTRAAGTEWALGVEARSRALVGDAEQLYRESIDRLQHTRGAVHLARSRLVYGEWLRRENRRAEARELLRTAHESFDRIGADAFAARAGRELRATGETARRLTADTRDALTPQEAQVARLARDGHTNPEIGARLYLSPRTVEYHLHKVFRKLDVSTRKDLRRVLAAEHPVG